MEIKPAFYKILMELSFHLSLPRRFFEKHVKVLPEKVELRIASGDTTTWEVRVEKHKLDEEDHYFFTKGWFEFCQGAGLQVNELLIFSYVSESTFEATVYATTGLEKCATTGSEKSTFIPPRCIVVLKDYRCYKIHVPKKFAEACGLFDKNEISLEYVGGHTSRVSIYMFRGQVAFGAGWSKFLKANELTNDISLTGSKKILSFEFIPTKNLIQVQHLHK